MRFPVFATFVFGLSLAAPMVLADANSDKEELTTLYTLTISQEMCSFELSDAQSEAIGGATDKLEEKLGLSEEESQKLFDQVTASLERQKPAGLCDAKGEWAKTYKEKLVPFGK